MGRYICRKCGVGRQTFKNQFCTSCQRDAEGVRIYDRAGAPIPGVKGYEARVQLQTEVEKRLVEETRAAIRAADSQHDRRLKERVERQEPKALAIQAAKRKSRDQWDQFSDNREKINAKQNALKAWMKEISGEDEVAALRASLGYSSVRSKASKEGWARLNTVEYEKRCSKIRTGVYKYFNELSEEELFAVVQPMNEGRAAWWARFTPEEQIAALQPMHERQRECRGMSNAPTSGNSVPCGPTPKRNIWIGGTPLDKVIFPVWLG